MADLLQWRWLLNVVDEAELSFAGHKDRYDDGPCACGPCDETPALVDAVLARVSVRILAEVNAMKEANQ